MTLGFVALLGGLSTFLWMLLEDARKRNLFLLHDLKPFKRKERLMSASEKKLFSIITSLPIIEKYDVFTQVAYSALIEVSPEMFDLGERFSQINNYRSDFVICDKETTKPLVVIELNDCSHKYSRTEARDRFVYSALKSANIPLIIFETKNIADKPYVENCINKELIK